MTDYTAIVSGAGPAGLAAATLLAQEGVKTAVIAPGIQDDPRTTALMQPAMKLLSFIGVWPGTIKDHSAPLKRLRLVDDLQHLVSAPAIEFAALEMNLEEFGFNVPLTHLVPALKARAEAVGVTFINAKSESATDQGTQISVTTDDGQQISAQVLLAADGAKSQLRSALGFSLATSRYDQMALVTSFDHSGPHDDVSTEWHKQDGPFTTVPLPGRRSSLVWMARPEKIEQLLALTGQELATEIQLESHGTLGRISNVTPRKTFAMKMQRATTLARSRTLLIGESAHMMPPIGAQGLNLSLRDAATAADLIIGAEDPGAASVCAAYDKARRVDVMARLSVTSLLNHSLLSGLEGFHLARATALAAVEKFPPLRHAALRQGLQGAGPLPFAMR
ncbi:FAD-dependent monooxygenase [Aestuariivirga litoralis]|uniref:FAD-dependent monooxygenase n=1 Tax=Aestuariivirga litoralis TaxID=2650924 RepID=UPI0018C79019|nr:FAD-dependent monooxygenase [Aestuariivirga litoralis]